MSASQWRRAMNSGASSAIRPSPASTAPCRGSASDGRRRAAGAAAARGAAPRRLAAPCRRAGGAARLSVRGDAVHHLPGRVAVAGARPDRALAHLPRRLRRHDLAGADDGRRHGRLCPRRARHQQRRRDQPRLAVVGGDPGGALHLRPRGDADRLAVGAHRRHLHDHDHAGDRRRLLLPGAAELQRLQRLPGPARDLPAQGAGHRLARPGAVLLPRARLRAGRLRRRPLGRAGAVRHRPAGHPRQPAAHERARLPRRRPPGRGLRAGRADRRRSAASSSSGTTA